MPSSRNPGAIQLHPKPPPYHIYEPHPTPSMRTSSTGGTTATTTFYMHSGRGGAGNIVKMPPASLTCGPDARGPASLTSLASQPSSSGVRTGRGGAGNIFHRVASEKRMFSFDEELQAQLLRERHVAPIHHVGRGGAGNTIGGKSKTHVYIEGSSRRRSSGSETASQSSGESGVSAAREIRRGVAKGWKKVAGVGDYMIG